MTVTASLSWDPLKKRKSCKVCNLCLTINWGMSLLHRSISCETRFIRGSNPNNLTLSSSLDRCFSNYASKDYFENDNNIVVHILMLLILEVYLIYRMHGHMSARMNASERFKRASINIASKWNRHLLKQSSILTKNFWENAIAQAETKLY